MSKKSLLDTSNLKGDIFGGITAGVVALPLALAFGVQSGMGPAAGLYGAIALGIFAAIFGGTPSQVSGPTAPMTVVSVMVVAAATQDGAISLENGMWMIVAVFMLSGLFQVLFGVLKIGKYIKYIPYPVISGFLSGIGVIIILGQIYPFFGQSGAPKDAIGLFASFANFPGVNWAAVGLGAGTIAIIYLFPKITKMVPASVVALVAGTGAAVLFKLDVPVIGEIPTGIPEIQLGALGAFDFSNLGAVILPAFTLAALGSIDSLLTSVVADNITKTRHNSNRELIGQGIGNMIGSIFGGLPGAGATIRTVVNVNAGGRTRISGVIHGILLLIVMLGAGSLAAKIPFSVLAGILITVGIGIIDKKGLKHLFDVPRADAVIMVVVLLLTVFVDLLQAVGVGMVLASLLFMKKVSDVSESRSEITELENEKLWEDEQKAISPEISNRIYIKHLYGPLTFGFVSGFKDLVALLPKEVKIVVLRMDRVPFIDQSGLYVLEDFAMDLRERKIPLILVGVESQPKDKMEQVNLVPDLIPEGQIAGNMKEAVEICHRFLNWEISPSA